ncbi:MAG: MBL fold metallo-hydrolase [Gemmatimonadaceae bacterium]|nr:MBL fold metallo-hydrolase [Gemmatimonadaceae bacterium]
MVEQIVHAGVTEWKFSTRRSRLIGYTASAFLTADGVLVDTGIPARRAELEALLDRHPVRGVMVTHHHEDHAGNVEAVARRGLPLWLPAATRPLVTAVAPIRLYRSLTWTPMPPLVTPEEAFVPDSLVPVATPGHSVDHHAFWDGSTRTLFSGDLFLGVKVRIAHHDEDPWTLLASLERAAALEPLRLFDAHRGLVPDAAAALRAKAAWTRDLITRIAHRIDRGDSDARILREQLGGESMTGRASFGEYSRRNLVAAVRRRPRDQR